MKTKNTDNHITRQARYLDMLVDEFAKGKKLVKF